MKVDEPDLFKPVRSDQLLRENLQHHVRSVSYFHNKVTSKSICPSSIALAF